MSFVLDQVRRIDAQLDRVQLANLPSATSPCAPKSFATSDEHDLQPSARIVALQTSIRGLTPSASNHRALLRPEQIQVLLSALSHDSHTSRAASEESRTGKEPYETELEWLVVSKATAQAYGHVLKGILDQTLTIADDLWYWDETLGSRKYSALYALQISPFQFWHWSSSLWEDVKARSSTFNVREAGEDARDTIGQRWQQFYGLVRQVVRERSVAEVQKHVLSPVTRLRGEIRQKQAALKKIQLRHANALGVLLGEGLANESVHGGALATPKGQHRWKGSVARNVALMEAVLAKVNDVSTPVDKFDAAIAQLTNEDAMYGAEIYDHSDLEGGDISIQPQAVAERLARVLAMGLPQYTSSAAALVSQHGKPSRVVRYWLPVTVGILSSSTILRILVNRQAEIVQWVRELGATIVDFWHNWVVEPTRKVIGTIRHDEGSEVSIMSKRSLEGDRDSLERMVVDFAIDNPADAAGAGNKLTENEIADIRAKIREGDLTPVLKAYERDLASPLMGSLRGNLIRALLIQIQKTKVDVEVAMGGIDSLLKSQELVFGFVGLTPGILVTYFALHYLSSSFTEKRGSKARKQGKMLRQLRNIDRILTNSHPTEYGELFYKDQGLLLCEVHVLRQAAEKVMPSQIFKEFSEDAEDLCDVRIGAERQQQTAARMRWAYAKYLS
ncbi:NCA2-domain-containing protein [Hortaea werneckii]|nr:NCA2-domain-containing protein [Hortaea werneckii]